jgi:hypothetical protein
MEEECAQFTRELEKLMSFDIQQMTWSNSMDLLAIVTSNNTLEVRSSYFSCSKTVFKRGRGEVI